MEDTKPPVYSGLQENRILIGVIADAETTIGFLLAGIGETDGRDCNFMIVTEDTDLADIERFFFALYQRNNIGVILIATDILKALAPVLKRATKMLPVILEIPTKTYVIQATPRNRY